MVLLSRTKRGAVGCPSSLVCVWMHSISPHLPLGLHVILGKTHLAGGGGAPWGMLLRFRHQPSGAALLSTLEPLLAVNARAISFLRSADLGHEHGFAGKRQPQKGSSPAPLRGKNHAYITTANTGQNGFHGAWVWLSQLLLSFVLRPILARVSSRKPLAS